MLVTCGYLFFFRHVLNVFLRKQENSCVLLAFCKFDSREEHFFYCSNCSVKDRFSDTYHTMVIHPNIAFSWVVLLTTSFCSFFNFALRYFQ